MYVASLLYYIYTTMIFDMQLHDHVLLLPLTAMPLGSQRELVCTSIANYANTVTWSGLHSSIVEATMDPPCINSAGETPTYGHTQQHTTPLLPSK